MVAPAPALAWPLPGGERSAACGVRAGRLQAGCRDRAAPMPTAIRRAPGLPG